VRRQNVGPFENSRRQVRGRLTLQTLPPRGPYVKVSRPASETGTLRAHLWRARDPSARASPPEPISIQIDGRDVDRPIRCRPQIAFLCQLELCENQRTYPARWCRAGGGHAHIERKEPRISERLAEEASRNRSGGSTGSGVERVGIRCVVMSSMFTIRHVVLCIFGVQDFDWVSFVCDGCNRRPGIRDFRSIRILYVL